MISQYALKYTHYNTLKIISITITPKILTIIDTYFVFSLHEISS